MVKSWFLGASSSRAAALTGEDSRRHYVARQMGADSEQRTGRDRLGREEVGRAIAGSKESEILNSTDGLQSGTMGSLGLKTNRK